jgi:hypothetical protein
MLKIKNGKEKRNHSNAGFSIRISRIKSSCLWCVVFDYIAVQILCELCFSLFCLIVVSSVLMVTINNDKEKIVHDLLCSWHMILVVEFMVKMKNSSSVYVGFAQNFVFLLIFHISIVA